MPVKTYRGPLWKVFHPARHLKSEYRKAKRQMRPARVIARVFSLDEVARALGTRTTHVTAETRKKQVARTAKKAPAKKAATKKTAAAGKTAVVTKRNKRGQFDSVKAMAPHELAMYQRAQAKADTPPPAVRWTGTRGAK